MNYYFEISDKDAVESIDLALERVRKFHEKLDHLKQKYKSDKEMIFNSSDRGLSFSCLAFDDYPLHLDTAKEFKINPVKYTGQSNWEARPRKTNKKFYKEFMQDIEDVSYKVFKYVLFGTNDTNRPNIEYTKVGNWYYISSNIMIALPHRELTATQYSLSVPQ